ncbi:alpha-hydroxy-acid oxidizing protein [Oceanidesulfovibrio indonesiensis]|uniref:Alpha-hydroxy-acid oxidizing protein n=1 Tax=Oceanidesulfovibrio indonesiensis TaxID=54767 RepID=A0A7M3MFY1_9BACT|nr:alpha-hydroxy-acid oxidizing protein [Oceanidesulfovibrio indonesiensis]TVM17690.1 alpha-hydroxy-acid oxidizing protein [Oceanidesulfovibrio indonesiensis]
MDYKAMRSKARERLKGYCRVCPVCDGRVCAGEVPGMGGTGTGNSFKANYRALEAVRLAMRTLHGVTEVETRTTCFGLNLATPIHVAPMTGVSYNMGGDMSEEEFALNVVEGAQRAGALAWTGDGADPAMFDSGLAAIAANGGRGVPIIKPRAQGEIIARIRRAEEAGAMAVGMDVDGAGLVTMAQFDQPVGPKNAEEIQEIVAATSLPFILKGIMTPDEAEIAVRTGCAAIVVSNHGGRVLDHTPGVAEVLPEIAKAVAGRLTVFADGAVRSGSDVLKLLALGADAVLVGRPVITGAFGGGAQGVQAVLDKMRTELIQAMLLTGVATPAEAHHMVLA